MYQGEMISFILPARNEALALPVVLRATPPEVDQVLVVNNGSKDSTAQVAREHDAGVVSELRIGYGWARLTGLKSSEEKPPDTVAFVDADGSDDLSPLRDFLIPLVNGAMSPVEIHGETLVDSLKNFRQKDLSRLY